AHGVHGAARVHRLRFARFQPVAAPLWRCVVAGRAGVASPGGQLSRAIALAAPRASIAVALMCCLPVLACAQRIPLSQQASVRQKVADTWIEIRYRRPTARGRSPLFGGSVVAWGETWTPSADSAVTITLSTPVKIENDSLPAGTWGI